MKKTVDSPDIREIGNNILIPDEKGRVFFEITCYLFFD